MMMGRVRAPVLAFLGLLALLAPGLHAIITDETEASEFMKELDARYSYECNREMVSRWDYITDVMDPDKENAANDAAVRYLGFKGEAAVNCTEYAYDGFTDIELYRRFRFLSKQGPGALNDTSLMEYKTLQAQMETTYSTATICDFYNPTECGLTLEPDIEAIMASSENWDELRYVWEEWREKTGKLMRDDFIRFVELSNQAATLDGFQDTGEYWLNWYTVDQREADTFTEGATLNQQEFRTMLDTVWTQVSEGLYKKLHAYVRMRLQEVYPGKIDPTGPIPSHILGNMWAQDWTNIGRYVMPFPEMPSFDVSDSMIENGWDIQMMFDAAEDFFSSIGLFNMTQTFRDLSVINQTAWGKTIVCHASAEDFCLGSDGDDYRIKMCTEVNMADLVTVHHEMGHIEYFMAYKNEPHVFRESANPGFHEAIGDLIALSVSTPQHLENILGLTPTRSVGVSSKYTDEEMRDLNFLMKMALEKIAFLPFGYLIDEYRWGVFDGTISSADLNAGWWNLRESLQGISPPEGTRGEEFFDPGAKYHVPANVPYIRYFVSFIVQFQFHMRLCEAAGYTGPLYTCDIYNNAEAGQILRSAMEKGFSEPWPKVLSELGESTVMDPQPIIDYFQPLIDYLDQTLQEADQCVGWGSDCAGVIVVEISEATETESPSTEEPTSTEVTLTTEPTANEDEARQAMKEMNDKITKLIVNATEYDWRYNTNVTEYNGEQANKAWMIVSSAYNQEYTNVIEYYQYENFKDDSLRRQFEMQQNRGTAALDTEDLEKLTSVMTDMTILFTNRICPEDKQNCDENDETRLSIDELEGVMATEQDYDKLRYYWQTWRDESGKDMRGDYKTYIELQNQAAINNGYDNAGDMWVEAYTEDEYTEDDFKNEVEELWQTVQPLYKKLHAYVRFHLGNVYKDKIPKDEKFIPAHILGNMWAQSWENIYDLVVPFPNVSITDITKDLENNITDVREMFKISENFFTSLGLYTMGYDFNNKSLYEQPDDREVICHASAWDFFSTDITKPEDGRFRIKMCTDKTQEDFIVIHHEMGHTEYQMAYSVNPMLNWPTIFRNGANPGFHEAIGDTIALSVSTPTHLAAISNMLQNGGNSLQLAEVTASTQENINFLMKTALAKVAFLPFAYIIDHWRWNLFNNTETDNYNEQWWDMRLNVQGIYPPVDRYPVSDFDPGSKYHVPAGVPYIRYFVSHILQFQFHKKLCSKAGIVGDIFNCDIYGSKEAGTHLKTMLKKGASVPWREQLDEFLEAEGGMDATAFITYFKPLEIYLDDFIKENKLNTTWDPRKVGEFMKEEPKEIPATVPIVVGAILAVMVLGVLIAYFVGRSKQKKKEAKKALKSTAGEQMEMSAEEGKVTAESEKDNKSEKAGNESDDL